MADLPIIFSAPMVRALLAGRKTQTRRLAWTASEKAIALGAKRRPSPWQKVRPGDRLWVRESGLESKSAPLFRSFTHDATPGRYWVDSDGGRYGASYSNAVTRESMVRSGKWKVRPSIHMPRWASRLTLDVTAVKIERLQDISEDDASAEGWLGEPGDLWPINWYRDLWNSLHGAGSWDGNPEVVAISFTVRKDNIDKLEIAA